MLKKHAFLLLYSIFLFSSCRGTFYDEQVSLTAQITSRLNEEASFGSIFFHDICYNEDEGDKAFFLPEKEDYKKGFIIIQADDYIYIYYLDGTNDAQGPFYTEIDSYSESGSNYLIEPVPDHPRHLLFIDYDPEWYNTRFDIIKYDESKSNIESLFSEQSLGNLIQSNFGGTFGSSPQIYGAYISPLDNRLYILCLFNSEFYEVSYLIDFKYYPDVFTESHGVYDDNSPINFSISLQDNIDLGCNYFYDSKAAKSVLSIYSGKGNIYTNYFWDSGQSPTKLSMEDHITNLLSSSLLFTRDYKKARIYNLKEEMLYEFPMGDLNFNYETNIGDNMYDMLFSLGYVLRTSGDCHEIQYYFYIYSWPTNEINKLD